MSKSRLWKPDELLYELAMEEPDQINVEAIARFCGVHVLYEPIQGCEANILGNGDRAIVTVNSASPVQRQRFSIGHELGHWMHDRGTLSLDCDQRSYFEKWFLSGADAEVRANRFAADLLLPRSMFEPRARGMEPSFHNVRELATIFRASLTATAIRLVELGDYCSLIYCAKNGRRGWFKASEGLPSQMWPKDWPGLDSLAHRLRSRPSGTELGPEKVRVDNWFEHKNGRDCFLQENSFKLTQSLTLSLLWWKTDEQLDDLLGDEEDLFE